ncbi:hypothetical protein K435DRAFT_936145 [Dendrothele bispora CBS 962.96]|uniref:Uncharacterized protein n=1 Tax=Dendrothele bispora (strain CBS 962.96) TaxID=1314807 RepID=A0A4S8KZP2_DENBC|nr:hypothetical protein K435DRAFT_936145 [Dendrothele bispora CBS 962.96]
MSKAEESTVSQVADTNEAMKRSFRQILEVDEPSSPTSPTSQAPTKSVTLTMPQSSPDMPPRPEFTPFQVPNLCESSPYDGKDFWTYPERYGWIVHAKDACHHVLCPPRLCRHGMGNVEFLEKSETRLVRHPMLSRLDSKPVLASDKVAFLQAWLFFGLLTEVSNLCGLDLDIAAEFIIKDGLVSTTRLNGLPERWYEALARTGRVGDKTLMENILTFARHSCLMLSEEFVSEHTFRFQYTYTECRVLQSLQILVRIIGLHLLLHTYTPGFAATEEEGWEHNRISNSLTWSLYRSEGMDQLSDLARDDLEEQGWCESELDLLGPDELTFASLISRPRIRDHSHCGDVICDAYQTDEATYRTRHVKDGCSCDFVSVETDILTAALSEDKIPKLLITRDLKIQTISEPDYPYIALSHVCMLPLIARSYLVFIDLHLLLQGPMD